MFQRMTIAVLVLMALASSACANYSAARDQAWKEAKEDSIVTIERAMAGKLKAPEMRSFLESFDKSRISENALKGNESELGPLQKQLESDSDEATAKLFNGDNGRTE